MYPLMLTAMGEIPLDSPTYPTCYSGIGRTVEFGGLEWDSGFHGQSHLSYMLQWDTTDSRIWWARVGQWISMDSPTCPTCYSGIGWTVEFGGLEWDSGFPWTVPPVLHVTVG